VAREFRRFFRLSVALRLVGLVPVRAQSNGSQKVRITDNRGFPDPNAALTLVSEDRVRKVKADKAGEFEFTNLPFRTYVLEVSSPSFKDNTVPDIPITSEDRKDLTIQEQLYTALPEKSESTCQPFAIDGLPGLGELVAYEERTGKVNFTGKIVGVFHSNPLRDATIHLFKFGSTENIFSTANTDDRGTFEFSHIEPGNYTLSISRVGYYASPPGFRFWITRENLTRVGNILLFPDSTQDLCGGMVMLSAPAIVPPSITPPDLVIPIPLPLPQRPKAGPSR